MSERIRVLEIISGFAIEGSSGGMGRFGVELSRAMPRNEFDTTLCGLWDQGTAAEKERIAKLRTEGVRTFAAARWNEKTPYRCFWQAFQEIRAFLDRHTIDIVHSHSEFGDVVALLLKVASQASLAVRTIHNHEWKKRPLRRHLLTNLVYPLTFDLEIGVSQALTNTLNRRPVAYLLKRQALTQYNAIDWTRFKNMDVDPATKKKSLNLPSNSLVIGTAGRLVKQKGIVFLLRAIPKVLKLIPEARFLIIGSGELDNELKELADRLNISHHTVFTGRRNDMEELLAILDLFVSPSLWEGLPTAILESMAAGVPVVATDIPGTRELIRHKENGWLVPPEDVEALTGAIVHLLKNRERARSLTQQALNCLDPFLIGTVAQKQAAIYRRILHGSKRVRDGSKTP